MRISQTLQPRWPARARGATVVVALIALAAGTMTLPAQGAATAKPRQAAARVTTPKAAFGFAIGDDYRLANYTQLAKYWETLARESDRMALDTIGRSAEGRPQLMAIVTSPANHRNLARYKEISRRLALAEGLADEQAKALAAEGKAVVWIDGGLHATEVLGAHQLMETAYQLLSGDDPETRRFLDDLIVLFVHANPDGMELVSDWYMREPDETKRTFFTIPRLYQKYIGHDNNRDFYMVTQPETQNMARVLFREWFPQVMYNHHQTGPAGTVMFAPPFRDPFNYNFDPLVLTGIDLVGAAMHNRFVVEDKPGTTMRRGANYSTWWNGGLRTTVYFHNMIGLLTETIGSPTPMTVPFLPNRQLPSADLPFPVPPQQWHFRQSVDYSVTANKAVLDVASRHREQFLYNIYKMGRNSIERGSRDHWTPWPKRLERIRETAQREGAGGGAAQRTDAVVGGGIRSAGLPMKYWEMLHEPTLRDPRAYVLPSNQPDFPTATKFVNALIKTGVTVHRATASFAAGGKTYPAGSYVVRADQAFRPHVLDMFEPQDHPNDFPYPGGPPIPPYDNAGWTLAYQMGVQFDRILDAVAGPLRKIDGFATPLPGTVARAPNGGGYLLSPRANDAALAVNRLLKAGQDVYRLRSALSSGGEAANPGTFYVGASGSARASVERLAKEVGVSFGATRAKPSADAVRLRPVRIGLWDRYGGSMPSGWTRWIMEQYEFPFEVVYPRQLDAGNLRASYDVLIFVDGAIPEGDGTAGGGFGAMPDTSAIPSEFRGWLGRVTVAETVPQLKTFLESGGTIITIGSSTALGSHLGLPVANHLIEQANGTTKELPREKYYIPGSLLEVKVDSTAPVAYGMGSKAIVMFDNSPVFRLGPNAAAAGVKPVAWFADGSPLRSGWAWGEKYLDGGVAVAVANVGQGTLYMFGPEILFRAQPHGTFKFFFNGIYEAGAGGR
ncbi:MAG: M14 family metallopeptidase [Gemmatimonadota bacterium]|nr:M14 family metallopeptidase [Gemmatimonadota bacterium]